MCQSSKEQPILQVWWMVLWKPWVLQNVSLITLYTGLANSFFSGYGHLTVSIFRRSCLEVPIRSFICFYIQCLHNSEKLVRQRCKCVGWVKEFWIFSTFCIFSTRVSCQAFMAYWRDSVSIYLYWWRLCCLQRNACGNAHRLLIVC